MNYGSCGRWRNGRLVNHCTMAGTEECDFECPHRDEPADIANDSTPAATPERHACRWLNGRCLDCGRAYGEPRTSGVATGRRPLGCALAMRVMQSDLYQQLDEAERADCDELVQRNLEWFKQDSAPGVVVADDETFCTSESKP